MATGVYRRRYFRARRPFVVMGVSSGAPATMPLLKFQGSGVVSQVGGQIAVTMPLLEFSATGDVTPSAGIFGQISITMPLLQFAGTGTVIAAGLLGTPMPLLQFAGVGTVTSVIPHPAHLLAATYAAQATIARKPKAVTPEAPGIFTELFPAPAPPSPFPDELFGMVTDAIPARPKRLVDQDIVQRGMTSFFLGSPKRAIPFVADINMLGNDIQHAGAFYFGPSTTVGSWRLRVVGTTMRLERLDGPGTGWVVVQSWP